MEILQKMKAGEVGDFGVPEKIVDTLLSNVFFFGERVVKMYKHQAAFYGNLADDHFRRIFYGDDFSWNQGMSPDIYLVLQGVARQGGRYEIVPFEQGSDWLIEMRRIDGTQTLTNLLQQGRVTGDHVTALVQALIDRQRTLTAGLRPKINHLFQVPLAARFTTDLNDLRDWMYLAKEYIPTSMTNEIISGLQQVVQADDYFVHYDPQHLSAAIDANGDNLLLLGGEPSFIDCMSPKENWRVNDELFNVARVATDAAVLGSRALAQAAYGAYEGYGMSIPDVARRVYEVRSALIQWTYRHIMKQPDIAARYERFSLDIFKTLIKKVS